MVDTTSQTIAFLMSGVSLPLSLSVGAPMACMIDGLHVSGSKSLLGPADLATVEVEGVEAPADEATDTVFITSSYTELGDDTGKGVGVDSELDLSSIQQDR